MLQIQVKKFCVVVVQYCCGKNDSIWFKFTVFR